MVSFLQPPSTLDRRHSLESSIGNTPLFRLRHVATDVPLGVEVYGKGEHLNPGG